MTKRTRITLLAFALLALGCTVWYAASPGRASAQSGNAMAASAAGAETWTLGVTVEGAPTYSAVVGRLVSSVASFRTNRGVSEAAMIFPAPSTARTVQAARYMIVSRTGNYPGDVILMVGIYDMAGNLQHLVSAGKVDLKTATMNTWTTIPLSEDAADATLAPGEFLACTVTYRAGAGGDMDVRPAFEIKVRQP
ncbi:MAG: hypothetical protein ACYC4R_05355 [Anaerolineae bacterium]